MLVSRLSVDKCGPRDWHRHCTTGGNELHHLCSNYGGQIGIQCWHVGSLPDTKYPRLIFLVRKLKQTSNDSNCVSLVMLTVTICLWIFYFSVLHFRCLYLCRQGLDKLGKGFSMEPSCQRYIPCIYLQLCMMGVNHIWGYTCIWSGAI